MARKTTQVIENIAGEIGPVIYGYSTVSDNWVNQLKIYRNITLTEDYVRPIWIYTMALLIEFAIARIEDLITPTERTKLESEIIYRNVNLMILIFDVKDSKARPDIEKMIMNIIADHRKIEKENNQTIFDTYLATFIKTFKQIPEEILTDYLNDKIQFIEKQNFRKLFI